MGDLLAVAKGNDDDGDASSRLENRMIDSSDVRVHKHGVDSRLYSEPREIDQNRAV